MSCNKLLVRVCEAVIKFHHQTATWGGKNFFLMQFILQGRQRRSQHRGRGRVLLTGLLLEACSVCFRIRPRTVSPRMAPFTVCGHQPRRCPTDLPACLSYGDIFSVKIASSKTWFSCVRLTKANQPRHAAKAMTSTSSSAPQSGQLERSLCSSCVSYRTKFPPIENNCGFVLIILLTCVSWWMELITVYFLRSLQPMPGSK